MGKALDEYLRIQNERKEAQRRKTTENLNLVLSLKDRSDRLRRQRELHEATLANKRLDLASKQSKLQDRPDKPDIVDLAQRRKNIYRELTNRGKPIESTSTGSRNILPREDVPKEIIVSSDQQYKTALEEANNSTTSSSILKSMLSDIDYDKLYGIFSNTGLRGYDWMQQVQSGSSPEYLSFQALRNRLIQNIMQGSKGAQSEADAARIEKAVSNVNLPKARLLGNIRSELGNQQRIINKGRFLSRAQARGLLYDEALSLYNRTYKTGAEIPPKSETPTKSKAPTTKQPVLSVKPLDVPEGRAEYLNDNLSNRVDASFNGELDPEDVEEGYKDFKALTIAKTNEDINSLNSLLGIGDGNASFKDQISILIANLLAPFEDSDKAEILKTLSDNFKVITEGGKEFIEYKAPGGKPQILEVNKEGFDYTDLFDILSVIAVGALAGIPNLGRLGATWLGRLAVTSAASGLGETARQSGQEVLGGEFDKSQIVGATVAPTIFRILASGGKKALGSIWDYGKDTTKSILNFIAPDNIKYPDFDWSDPKKAKKIASMLKSNNLSSIAKLDTKIPRNIAQLSKDTGIDLTRAQALNDPELLTQQPFLATLPLSGDIAKKFISKQDKQINDLLRNTLDNLGEPGQGNLRKELGASIDKLKKIRFDATEGDYKRILKDNKSKIKSLPIRESIYKEITDFKGEELSDHFLQKNPAKHLYLQLKNLASIEPKLQKVLPSTRNPSIKAVESSLDRLESILEKDPDSVIGLEMKNLIDDYLNYIEQLDILSEPSKKLLKLSKRIPEEDISLPQLHELKKALNDMISDSWDEPSLRTTLQKVRNSVVDQAEQLDSEYKSVNNTYRKLSTPIDKLLNESKYKKLLRLDPEDTLEIGDMAYQIISSLKNKPGMLTNLRKNIEAVDPKAWSSIARDFFDRELRRLTSDVGDIDNIGSLNRLMGNTLKNKDFWNNLIPEANKKQFQQLGEILTYAKKGRMLGSPTASRTVAEKDIMPVSLMSTIMGIFQSLGNSRKKSLDYSRQLLAELMFNPQAQEMVEKLNSTFKTSQSKKNASEVVSEIIDRYLTGGLTSSTVKPVIDSKKLED